MIALCLWASVRIFRQVVNGQNGETCYDLVDTREPATVLNLCYKVDKAASATES